MLKVVIKTVINFIKVRNMKYLSDYMPQFPSCILCFIFVSNYFKTRLCNIVNVNDNQTRNVILS